jgi:EAL domain-containing protein (putative c-di-GMP-specific phosphodiesterase class I)
MIQADTAMYQAKENGRNSTQLFIPEMQIIAKVKLALEKDLRYAIKRNEMQVYYQPQTNIKGDLIGAEALLRWIHPQRGHISPTDFIPIAEESGMILELGDFVLKDACKRIMQWKSVESLKHIAVNVSPVQFRHPDYVTSVEKIIQEYSLDTKKLTLELTEGLLVNNVEDVIKKMQKLKNLGISFSIDDFGTGYSSLAYLTKFPLDQLKIDKSFVDDIGKDQDDQVIIETIIAMADRLSFNLIAEGVETNEQIQFLKEKGCFNFQGYYFSKPMAVKEFSEKYL